MAPFDNGSFDPLSAWANPWRDWWLQAGAFQRASLDWLALCWDPASRNRWLAGMSQLFDRYARSPGFLELAQHNLRALTVFQRLGASLSTRQELFR